MDIVIHAGAHITDEDRLTNCLLQNAGSLAAKGMLVPEPQRYRKLLRDQINSAKQMGLAEDASQVVLQSILKGAEPERVILSNPGFFGTPKMAIAAGTLYGAAENRLQTLHEIFEGHTVSLCLAICNPATFLPAIFAKARVNSFDEFMNGADPRIVRWSEMIGRIRAAFPEMPMTVWCNEDLPLIWSEIIRTMAGLAPDAPFEGEFTFLQEIMTDAGLQRFHTYLESHPGMTESQKRRVIMAFLDKFAREEAIEEEVSIFGWTDTLIDELTYGYDQDLAAIQAIPDIDLITP